MLPGIPSIQQELSHGRDVAFGMMTKQTSVNCDQSELEKSILTSAALLFLKECGNVNAGIA